MPTTPPTPTIYPMFGVWNEHWKNHPAGLPISQYKPNTNPNQGVVAGSNPTTAPAPSGTAWNAWYQDFSGAPPTAGSNAGNTPATGTTSTTPPSTTTTTTPGTTPTTGFASKYTPAMMEQAYENPWYILQDVFNGVSTSAPIYQALRDLGGDPLALYNIAKGSQGLNSGGAADFVNWLADMYQNQGKVGGTDFSAQQLLGGLFGQQKFGADSTTSIGQILGAGDMSTQVRTLYNLARDASNVSLNPLAARGYQSALAQAGDAYGRHMLAAPPATGANAASQNPAAWIKANMPWLTMGGA